MSCLYVTEQGAAIRAHSGKIVVDCRNGSERSIPEELVESIVIFGNVQMEISAQKKCLEKGITTSLLSTKGKYFGRLISTSFVNANRLKKQVYLSDDKDACIAFAQKTLSAKVHNQLVLLRRYARTSRLEMDLNIVVRQFRIYQNKILNGKSIEEIMGYEGAAARLYFSALSDLVQDNFKFNGRNKRPPKDAFNAMLSLGYTMVFYEIYAELENHGLNPYIGLVHQIKEHHPTLASDMLEEWRAPIVDATVMKLVQGNEISVSDFLRDEDTGAVVLNSNALKIFTRALERKMKSTINYLSYLKEPLSFRRAIWWQAKSIAHCVDGQSLKEYEPLRIR